MGEAAKATSAERAAVFIKAAFEALKEAGASLPLRDIKAAVRQRVQLSPRDLETYPKTGYVRWESILHFYSIDCVKAGFIRKHSGRWHLTPEGERALALPPREIIERASRAYQEWKAAQPGPATTIQVDTAATVESLEEKSDPSFVIEQAQADARAEIEEYVRALGPYDFQDLVAALLRGMGYATTFTSERGPDGGTDILAYPDALGAKTPHVRVQVKHRASQKASREEIAALRGIIRQDREIGLFVSSAGFTSEAMREARHGGVHIQLMDLDNVLDDWVRHYERMSEEDKSRLRLKRVYFLSPE